MKPCLADVNILLPLLVRHHEHHKLALEWFGDLAAGECFLCRHVQLALVRLLGNKTIMQEYALSAAAAWNLVSELLEDERIEFLAEPALLSKVLPKLFKYSEPPGKFVGDAYLAAFAIAGEMRLVTIDQGFQQFRGLDLQLVGA